MFLIKLEELKLIFSTKVVLVLFVLSFSEHVYIIRLLLDIHGWFVTHDVMLLVIR